MQIVNCFIGVVPGKESAISIERISEVTGVGERSPGEETGHGYTSVHAGTGDSTG
jgi:hypothetical protein